MNTDIPVCKSQDEENSAFYSADEENRPHLFIRSRQKYAYVEADMITTGGHDLSDNIVDKIDTLLEDYTGQAYNDPEHKQTLVSRGCGPGLVSIGPLRIPIAKKIAEEIGEMVFDKDNWIQRRSIDRK